MLFGFAAESAQSDTGVIGQRAIGKNFAAQLLCDFAEVGKGFAVGCQTRVLIANAGQHGSQFTCEVQQAGQLENLGAVQNRAFDAQAGYGGAGVGSRLKSRTDGGAARCGLRLGGGASVFERFSRFRQSGLNRAAIGKRLDQVQLGSA